MNLVPDYKAITDFAVSAFIGAGAIFGLHHLGHSFGDLTPFVTAGAATAVHYLKGVFLK